MTRAPAGDEARLRACAGRPVSFEKTRESEIITNPSNFLKIHNFFILDPIFDPKTDLECSTKIDFTYDTFSLIEKVSKQR